MGDERLRLQVRAGYLFDLAENFCGRLRMQYKFEDRDLRLHISIVAKSAHDLMDAYIRPLVAHGSNPPRLCRHKIIAATQCAIMARAPLRIGEPNLGGHWGDKTREINAQFAHYVSLDMLERWLDYRHENSAVQYLSAGQFVAVYQENLRWLVNLRFINAEHSGNRKHHEAFNFLVIAQLWSMFEIAAKIRASFSTVSSGNCPIGSKV